jgi:DDE_Tnp_1-associated
MVRSLLEVLSDLPDPRQAKGKRHSLVAVLSVVLVALLSGQNSLRQIAHWAQGLDRKTRQRLGLRRGRVPSYSTIRRVLLGLAAEALAQRCQAWTEEALPLLALQTPDPCGVALDAKTLRQSGSDTTPSLQVLNAALHQLYAVVGTQAIPNGTNAIGAAPTLLEDMILHGRVVTLDAQLAQRELAAAIPQKGGPI